MSLDWEGLTTDQVKESMSFFREAAVNMFIRGNIERIKRAIGYLEKDLEFRSSIQAQKKGRVHKGAAYYNLGICHLFEENWDVNKAVYYLVLAHIEDCISNAAATEVAESMDAARFLKTILEFDSDFLRQIGTHIRLRKSPWDILNPAEILSTGLSAFTDEAIKEANIAELCKNRSFLIPRKRPFFTDSRWENRVFIGGVYSGQTSNILKIKEFVYRLGFEPVIADDYIKPEEMTIRRFSFMLLHTCKFAIFDVTHPGGQYSEIERAKDYGIEPRVVFSADSTTRDFPLSPGTSMLEEKLYSYKDIDTELMPIIRDYLSQANRKPS